MKTAFSTSWKSSVQPRKQRKYTYNAPYHLRGKFLNVHLSKELASKYGTRAVRVRVGDKVRVLRGTHKGKEGKVERVDLKNLRVYVSKIEVQKIDGSVAKYPLQPSNLMILSLADDKKRFKRSSSSSTKSASTKSGASKNQSKKENESVGQKEDGKKKE